MAAEAEGGSLRRDRLSQLIEALDVKNTEIAGYCGFDRTNLSRIKSGARKISSGSSTASKLIDGLFACAAARGKLDTLCGMVHADPAASSDEIKRAVGLWLFEDEESSQTERKPRKRAASFRTFSGRLDRIMNLTGISNSQLSQLINADASIISRYRTGVRVPTGVSGIAPKIAGALWDRISRDNRQKELAKMLKLPEDYLDGAWFAGWLCEPDTEAENERSFAERMLGAFEAVRGTDGITLPDFADIAGEDLLNDSADVYTGTEGFRLAILRFLGNAAKYRAEELLLYSDEGMDWMTADPAFRNKWAMLMGICVKNGTRIRIIHNIRRDLNEMSDAIINWLPLYMSGMIESYYCTRPEKSRFSHTLFLNPGEYCIGASHVAGTEENGIYHYYTGRKELTICREQYDALLSISRPLVSMAEHPQEREDDPEARTVVSGNIRIRINETSVQVTHLVPPEISLVFGHPLMCRAFRAFADSLET